MTFTTVPAAGQFGFIPDSLPQELPVNAWSYVQNARFRDGYAEKFGGSSAALTTPVITPYFITPYRSLNAKFWVYAGATSVYCDDGATQTNLTPGTPFTGTQDDRWTGGAASGVMVINNGVDQPHYWAGNTGSDFAILTGWNSAWRAQSLRPFKNYLVALNITKSSTPYQSMVKWSAAANPGAIPASWDETDPTLDAGEQDLAETTDILIDQIQLGDINVIYKEKSMYGMQFIGQPFIFRFYRLPGEVGMLARGCGVNTPKGHVVLTAGDLVIHNGQGPQSLVNARTRRWLFNNIDTTNFARSFLCTNPSTNEVFVCFPESGQTACTKALVWNWVDDTFGVRELPNATFGASGQILQSTTATWASDPGTWASDSTTWGNDGYGSSETRLLLSCSTPLITLMDTGTQYNSVNPTVTLERTGMAFDSPDVIKTVKAVIPRIEAIAGTVLSIQVGGSMDAEVAPTWSTAAPYTVGTSRKADCFATGRFLSLRISSSGSPAWRLKSFDLDMDARGVY